MKVLVAGGTGFIGRHLSQELVDRGYDVVAVSRHPDTEAVPDGVSTRAGDVTEYERLPETVEDADVIVNLVALSPLHRPSGGERMHERVHVQGTRNLVRAMEAVDVDRILHVSGVGADPEAPTAFLRAKGRAEQIVRAAACDHTVVRPTVVFGDGGEFVRFIRRVTTPYLTGLPGGGRMQFQPIWVGDLAPLLANAIAEDQHVGQAYDLGGPERQSLATITRTVYGAAGRSVRIVPIPMPLAGLGLTVAGPIPGIPFGRDQYRALALDTVVEHNQVEQLGGTEPELNTLASYLRSGAPE